jgi:NAD(P)H dehydrogenase (quinone)
MRIAVTGASGRLGGQVARLLAADEAHHVVLVARREIPSAERPGRVSMACADYAEPATLCAAFRGVDTVVFVSSDGEAAQVLVNHQNVIRAAADSGVGHIVALSGLDADLGSPFCYAVTCGHTERLLLQSGCQFSIVRASIYIEFLLEFVTPARANGQIRLPAADGRLSLVSRTDVGRCLAALVKAAPTGRHHDITGPESLDLHTIARLAQRAWDRPVEYVEITPSEHHIEMARAGEDSWWMYAYSTMFASVRQQRWAAVSDEVLRLTGSPPRSFSNVVDIENPF